MSKGWTEAQKAEASRKAKERWDKMKAQSQEHDGHVSRLVAAGDVPAELKAAQEEIARLKAELAAKGASATAQFFAGQNNQEVPSGKTREVEKFVRFRVTNYDDKGRAVRVPEFELVAVPTYYYTIDMPPVGGQCLRVNGAEYYHNETYEFDIDTLRMVKSMVWNVWKHDSDIHNSNENAYRKQTNRTFSMRA